MLLSIKEITTNDTENSGFLLEGALEVGVVVVPCVGGLLLALGLPALGLTERQFSFLATT
jgi:hypothetical protein